MDKHGNDKNDFLQTQRIRQLDKLLFFTDTVPRSMAQSTFSDLLRSVDNTVTFFSNIF